MAAKDKPAQRTKAGGRFGKKLDPKIVPDDAVPFGDGRHLYSPSQKALLNVDACITDWIEQEDD